jgi:hypothetical protein
VGFLEFAGERVAIRAGQAAPDLTVPVPRAADGRLPGLIVGHRAFDQEEAAVVADDDQEERDGQPSVGHGLILSPFPKHVGVATR